MALRLNRLIGVFGCCLLFSGVQAQQPPQPPLDLEQFIEQRFGLPREDFQYEDLYETLFLFYTQPLNLNKATLTQLESLHLLSPDQIQSFFRYRQLNGELLSLYELQAVPGFDLLTIQNLLPFVQVVGVALPQDKTANWRTLAARANRYLIMRYERLLERRRGYIARADTLPPVYAGSPDKLYLRLRLSHAKDFSLGLTAEKDAGERLGIHRPSGTYGADFYSFHAVVHDRGRLKRAALGDFQVQWGQGLVSGAGFYLGKGAEAVAGIMRASTGIRPYTSVVENGFYRGGALSYQLAPRWQVTALASRLANDASLTETSDGEGFEEVITSIRSSGLHRTASELAGKNQVIESNIGSALEYTSADQRTQLGFSGLYTHLNRNLQLRPRPYNQQYFRGSRHGIGSVFGRHYLGSNTVFGEVAYSTNGGLGAVGGATSALSRNTSLAVLYRYYHPAFHTFYGVAFSESSSLRNESGVYVGITHTLNNTWQLSAYLDRFWFPQPRFGAYQPSEGYEQLLRLAFKPNKTLHIYSQYRNRVRERNRPETAVYTTAETYQQQALVNLEVKVLENLSLRSRWQGSWYRFNGNRSQGSVLWQDVHYQQNQWSISTRLALFQTDDYNTRQYAFERDVLWAFSVPAYYGQGLRYYLLVQYKILPQLTLWARWARTTYRHQTGISSGNEAIEGHRISQVKLQAKWDF